MLILFGLIVMRVTGAIAWNPIFGRTGVPARFRAALILFLSLMLYSYQGGALRTQPETLVEFGVMLVKELSIGFCMNFAMEIAFTTLRFATSVMDFSMGLNMAQVYDPSTSAQSTVTTGLFYNFLLLLLVSTDGHLHFLSLFFQTAERIPFGEVDLHLASVSSYMLYMFRRAITTGLQIAFPIMGIELMAEVALGILMRMIPQINLFVVNFQVKIISGLTMLFLLLSPMNDRIRSIADLSLEMVSDILRILTGG